MCAIKTSTTAKKGLTRVCKKKKEKITTLSTRSSTTTFVTKKKKERKEKSNASYVCVGINTVSADGFRSMCSDRKSVV